MVSSDYIHWITFTKLLELNVLYTEFKILKFLCQGKDFSASSMTLIS